VTFCFSLFTQQGRHILIDRDDRKSQLRTFKDGLAWLEQGVPIMAFPEGMRSHDGRLIPFKKGLFSLAVKAQVPIVPITLSNTHAIMPTYSFFPVQPGAGKIHVHIGTAIDPQGRTEAELEALVRHEFLAHLPPSQLPVVTTAETVPEEMPVAH
jgi:1-acyl-sn-glycerol-3-phosphate acyltransferase